MSCVEKRHMSHRVGSMLHHRFPNGFTDLFMDETDREVSTLTDRAFRSLCVGDDAVYNDELLYGYSPFSCHKPLVGEPLKKTHHKESKKQGQNKNDVQVWKQQQHKNLSHMSSFFKALSATEESCTGLLIKNGGMTDSNGESWDKSALRSIQKELSEFSEYHTNLTGEHYKNQHLHQRGDGSSQKTVKDIALHSGKSSKMKNGKSNVKLKKLNVKNFFLHSEFSPFQTWRDFNQFPFGQEEPSVLPVETIPKWYDLPFYKELTEVHRKKIQHTEEAQSCQKTATESPPIASKPISSPPPLKVLPKPSVAPAEKRCSSDIVDGTAAPWRRNRSGAKSAIQVSQSGIPIQDNALKTVDESLVKKEARSVEVKAVEEVSSLASTPFSICQLMTPVIPSRQPTETSEILSPSALDLPLRPHSEAKMIPEPPVKRDNYKSLASSILFNLKDNRKRVKSRYSPPKFKTLELPESGNQSPQSDSLKDPQAGCEGNASGLSTPANFKDELPVCSPIVEPTITKHDADRPLSQDYLLSNLLQTKREAAGSSGFVEENNILPFAHSKKNKSPMSKKQNYPSLNLYKKVSSVDSDMKYLQVPLSTRAPEHIDQPAEANGPSPLMLNKELSPNALPTNTGLSPNTLNVNKDHPPIIPPHAAENERLSSNMSVRKRPPNVPDKAKQLVKDFGAQPTSREKHTSGQDLITMDVIREAISKQDLTVAQLEINNKSTADIEEPKQKETDVVHSKETLSSKRERSASEKCVLSQSRNESTIVTLVGEKSVRQEPPPVPKRNFAKSDIQLVLDKQLTNNFGNASNADFRDVKVELPPNDVQSEVKQGKRKHIFSAKQNNFIKYQRHAVADDEQVDKYEEGNLNVNMGREMDEEINPQREMRDSEHIINDLNALKELERARRSDSILESPKNKVGVININEEARAKNDLISKELRNIKKGMLSMRGNTLAKRELFAKKEKGQRKKEAFTKIDSNVIVNKALLNDNYDKAKVALEEIISERQKKKNMLTEQDENPVFEERAIEKSYITKEQQGKKAMTEDKEKQDDHTVTLQENDLKERLCDLRDHNHIKQILAQSEPRVGESHRWGGRIALPGMNKTGNELNAVRKTKAKPISDNSAESWSYESEEVNLRLVSRQVSNESEENLLNVIGGKKLDAPPVPPRSKKVSIRSNGSVTKETDTMKEVAEEDFLGKVRDYENGEDNLKEISVACSGKQEIACEQSVPGQSEATSGKGIWEVENNANSVIATSQSENRLYLSPEFKEDKKEAEVKPTKEATSENSNAEVQVLCRINPPSKQDYLNLKDCNFSKDLVVEDQPDKINRTTEETNEAANAFSEIPRHIMSPLLLVNGVSINQSPPDQASSSSKSSYFSVESALHKNTETESNVYHSLENLIGEEEDVDEEMRNASRSTKHGSDRTEVEYYSLSDHESESEIIKQPIISCQEEEVPYNKGKEPENTITDQSLPQDELLESPSNTYSPTLGIPALFKVKDNTFSNKSRKNVLPWSPRASLSGLGGEEELHQAKENPELPLVNQTTTSDRTLIPAEIFKPKDILSDQSLPPVLSPSNIQSENPKKPQDEQFLSVPQEEDRSSGVSPSSEGVESLTTSTADTADEMAMNAGVLVVYDLPNVPSERSGSTCSGNESQTGLPQPPAVLPKSEKAVLKAIKLTNRRMKKEEAQKSSHRSSQTSSKNKADRRKGSDNISSSSSRNSRSSERKHRGKMIEGGPLSQSQYGTTNSDRTEHLLHERGGDNNESHDSDRTETTHKTCRQNHNSAESKTQSKPELPKVSSERQGRSSGRHNRHKLDQRNYSSDRVISNVPVYKAHFGERPMSDRPFHRSQSTDRCMGDNVESKLSVDMSGSEKLDPKTQHIEKSIMDEFQQRGRAIYKTTRENPLRRSHSIGAYSSEVPHPILSRQLSHTSQLSRQSSIEHTIVTQSFPMTQRKLLQDPDSGQYFFVDMPVQVKTKTFFDPETGSYVQLPVQPPEGAVPQASPLEVLTPPLVVYHSFVPVSLSPLAQKATMQAPHVEPEVFEQRRLERSRQAQCKETHPFLEPIYSQHEHMLGEFLGTEELDCMS